MEKSSPHNDSDIANILQQCNADIVISYNGIVITAVELTLFAFTIYFLKGIELIQLISIFQNLQNTMTGNAINRFQ